MMKQETIQDGVIIVNTESVLICADSVLLTIGHKHSHQSPELILTQLLTFHLSQGGCCLGRSYGGTNPTFSSCCLQHSHQFIGLAIYHEKHDPKTNIAVISSGSFVRDNLCISNQLGSPQRLSRGLADFVALPQIRTHPHVPQIRLTGRDGIEDLPELLERAIINPLLVPTHPSVALRPTSQSR